MMLSSLLALVACGPEPLPDTLGDCPDGNLVSWADVEAIFATNCARCHSSDLTGDDRNDAAEYVDFDSADSARVNDFLTWSMIWSEQMPPDQAGMSEEEAWIVWEWLSCGGPE